LRATKKIKQVVLLGGVALLLSGRPSDLSRAPLLMDHRSPPGTFAIRGISYPSFHNGRYAAEDSTASLADLAKTGANFVAIIPTRFSRTIKDAEFIATDATEADENVAKAIRDAHALGLSVLLKPHVDTLDGKPRAYYAPDDVDLWFKNYEALLIHYATIATENRVEMLSIGCELDSLVGSRYRQRWVDIIRSVRRHYAGPLIYASADWTGQEGVSFWDAVDYIGVDAYDALSKSASPSIAELAAGWVSVPKDRWMASLLNNKSPRDYYRSLAETYRKPVIFSEIGYRSVAGALARPGDWKFKGPVDLGVQARAYEALFAVWSKESSWMRGAFLWNWEPVPHPERTPGGLVGYTPQNKPALAVISQWYHRMAAQSAGR
jgi:hypothetical protein